MACALAAGKASAGTALPCYQPLIYRWNEDYSALCKSRSDDALLRIKCVSLTANGTTYFSFGGEYRWKIDDFTNPDFGLHRAPSFISTQHRYLAHMDLHLNDEIRVFVQLGGGTENGRKPFARPGDKGDVDIAQAFVDLKFDLGSNPWRLRVGRQEIALGRYITTREVTNIHRTFDGVRLDGGFDGWTVTAFAVDATRNRLGAFDDGPNPQDRIATLLASHPIPEITGVKIDLVMLEHENDTANYTAGMGRERRVTSGARVYGGQGPWDIDAATTYQFGTFSPAGRSTLDINAWGMAVEGGWTFERTPMSPRLAIRTDLASGDRHPKDQDINTFDLPYPNLAYLSDAAIFAPRNIKDIHPFFTVSPTPLLNVALGAEFLWRFSKADAVYSFANVWLAPAGGKNSYVATLPDVRFDWHISPLVDLRSAIVVAIPGETLRTASGSRTQVFQTIALEIKF